MLDRQLHDSLVTKEVKQKVLLQAAELLDQQFLGNLLRIDTLDSIYCALENLVQKLKQEGDVSPFWNHGIGETCFKRVITSDMYYGR
jgi:pantothenate kinase